MVTPLFPKEPFLRYQSIRNEHLLGTQEQNTHSFLELGYSSDKQ